MANSSGYTGGYILNILSDFYNEMSLILEAFEHKELCCENRIAELNAELHEQITLLYRIQRDKEQLISGYSLEQKEDEGER